MAGILLPPRGGCRGTPGGGVTGMVSGSPLHASLSLTAVNIVAPSDFAELGLLWLSPRNL